MGQVRNWRWLPALALCVLAAGACGGGAELRAVGLLTDRTLEVDGIDRVYDLYVPETTAAGSAPLVILLHANRSSRDDLTGESRAVSPYSVWRDVADEEGLLLLIPQGVEGSGGHTGWNDCRSDSVGNPATDDVGFILGALQDTAADFDFDSGRVFVTGTSNGGHMAIRLAEEAPHQVAGIAVVAASMPANSECTSSDVPVSALFIVGTADPIAPFAGGAMASNRGEILSSSASIAYWLDRNSISGPPAVTVLGDIDTTDKSTVELSLYTGGVGGTNVALYRIDGGGHTEPSVSARYRPVFELIVGSQNHDIEMADEVWSFFDSLAL